MEISDNDILEALHKVGELHGKVDMLEKDFGRIESTVGRYHEKANETHKLLNASNVRYTEQKKDIEHLSLTAEKIEKSVEKMGDTVSVFIKGSWVFMSVVGIFSGIVVFGQKLGLF